MISDHKYKSMHIINSILYTLNTGKKEFAESLGISPQEIYNILNEKNQKGLSDTLVKKIIEVYPDINIDFLKTGSGSVYKLEALNAKTEAEKIYAFKMISEAHKIAAQDKLLTSEAFMKSLSIVERIIDMIEQKNN